MFLHDKQHIAIAAGFVVLAGIAIAGWTHRPPSSPAPVAAVVAPPVGLASAEGQPDNAPESAPAAAEPDYGPGLSTDGYFASVGRPVYVRQAESPPPPPEPIAAQYAGGPAYYHSSRAYRRHHHRRSLGKSIAIVAGSAGAGAAIGAIAGGAPGAAIGAIAGGTGGFIYDRATHHH